MTGEDLLKIAERCVRCGKCRPDCPVFALDRNEEQSARGKLHILSKLLSGATVSPEVLSDVVGSCSLCGQCSAVCDAAVEAAEAVRVARALIQSGVISGDSATRALPQCPYISERLQENPALRFLISSLANRYAPALPQRNLMNLLEGKPIIVQPDAWLFPGCGGTWLFPQISMKALDLFKALSLRADIPREPACCALPLYDLGLFEEAKAMIEPLFSLMPGAVPIIVLCASCAAMLKVHLPRLFNGASYEKEARDLANRVTELGCFLSDQHYAPQARPEKTRPITVFLHDPCSMKYTMKMPNGYRKILEMIPRIQIADMKLTCCGHGGGLGLIRPEISEKIASNVADEIAQSNAKIVASNCFGCLLQLAGIASGHANPPAVVHTASLLFN